jgi:putative tryptophan/tyrosine transport system substrate-binding protein
MIERRAFVAGSVSLLAAPLAAEAQPAGKLYRIGFLSAGETPPFGPLGLSWSLGAFRQGFHALGYVDGRDFLIESRFADEQFDRLPVLAAELVALKVDVLVTVGTRTVQAAKAATATIPIVMAGVTDPVEHGIVASLARPGGNVTGTTYSPGPEIHGKGLELLKEAMPRISRVAVLWNSSEIVQGPAVRVQQRVAPKLGITLLPHDTKTLDELTAALATITRERADGLYVFGNFINSKHSDLILAFAAQNHLPTMYDDSDRVQEGGLMSYFTNGADVRRRAATFVDKILKGAKPGDLAIEQPTKFDLVVNLKTAKALGLTIAPSILARADQIIQ